MSRIGKRTYSTEGPQCPHCDRQFTADEPIYYDETRYTKDECDNCDNCGKAFKVQVHTSTSWACEPLSATTDASTKGDGN